MHSALQACPQPLLVRSLQLVEVWPYTEEEEEEVGVYSENNGLLCHLMTTTHNGKISTMTCNNARQSATLMSMTQRVTRCAKMIYDEYIDDDARQHTMRDNARRWHRPTVMSRDDKRQWIMTTMTTECSKKLLFGNFLILPT